ncbi:tRNA-dihydrouridine synthase [Candidatus Nomurabacteria bacterium]|nr:tRNA-dihydrouridine synthase [Candidatus Nomurabacteria bacterium]
MINLGFWAKLKKPIMVLAPMADVTDCVFRQIIAKYGKPDVFWTEFVSADGLAHPVAREKLLIDLKYSENEHPIVAQIFGGKPENIKIASNLCKELGFDGVDINMGCPDKSVEKQCAGSGMIKNPELSFEVIRAAKESGLPVSVKTRIGYNKNEIETWIRGLLEQDIAVLTVHLRTRKEMSDVPAHWDLMKRIVEIRDAIAPDTLIFGNGDVVDLEDGMQKVKETGCDGVMLGRAIFGNPFLFSKQKRPEQSEGREPLGNTRGEMVVPSISEKLEVMVEHTKLFEKELVQHKNFAIMKKHYKAYVNGFDGAKELRMKLMEAENATEVEKITKIFLEHS